MSRSPGGRSFVTSSGGPGSVPMATRTARLGVGAQHDVVAAGHEADGTPLHAASAAYKGGVYPGKVRHGFGGANVGYRKRELTLNPFEVLAGRFDGRVPRNSLLLHWRYYDDPPEFFTVLAGGTDGLHWGYFLDDPPRGTGCRPASTGAECAGSPAARC